MDKDKLNEVNNKLNAIQMTPAMRAASQQLAEINKVVSRNLHPAIGLTQTYDASTAIQNMTALRNSINPVISDWTKSPAYSAIQKGISPSIAMSANISKIVTQSMGPINSILKSITVPTSYTNPLIESYKSMRIASNTFQKSQNLWREEIQKLAVTNIKLSTQFNHIANSIGLTTDSPTEEQVQKRMEMLPPEVSKEVFDSSNEIISESIEADLKQDNVTNVENNAVDSEPNQVFNNLMAFGKNIGKTTVNQYRSLPNWKKALFNQVLGYASGEIFTFWLHLYGPWFTIFLLTLLFFQNVDKK